MKTIYISRPEPRSKKTYYIIGALLFFILALRAMAPLIIENVINHKGADDQGYAFRVDDVDLKIWRGVMSVGDVKVYNAKTNQNFVEARELVFDFDPTEIFDDKKIFSISGKEVNITLSKDFVAEVKRVKNETRKEVKKDTYLEKVEAEFDKINIQQTEKGGTRTLITLEETEANLRDFGVGSINEKSEFEVDSKIAGGGSIHLEGKTIMEKERTPWMIEGRMEAISAGVIEKLAGNKLPFEVEKANIDADIRAHSEGGEVNGMLEPRIKEFKLVESKDESFLKRNLAKVGNYLFDKTKGKDQEINLKLPFTLNENFTLNVPDTVEKLVH